MVDLKLQTPRGEGRGVLKAGKGGKRHKTREGKVLKKTSRYALSARKKTQAIEVKRTMKGGKRCQNEDNREGLRTTIICE